MCVDQGLSKQYFEAQSSGKNEMDKKYVYSEEEI